MVPNSYNGELAEKVMMLAMYEGALGNDSLESTMAVMADGGEQRWRPAIEVMHIAVNLNRFIAGYEIVPRLSKRADKLDRKYAANQDFERSRSNSQGNQSSGDEGDQVIESKSRGSREPRSISGKGSAASRGGSSTANYTKGGDPGVNERTPMFMFNGGK